MVYERLDHALCNDTWRVAFPEATVLHLPRVFSDHNPILIDLSRPTTQYHAKPFWFEAMWATHPAFEDLVKNAWQLTESFGSNLQRFTSVVQKWKDEVFCNIYRTTSSAYSRYPTGS